MDEFLKFLNTNSGALSVLFTGVVTLATAIYAALTWVLVNETRMMREVQTEPKLQVTVASFDFAIKFVRLQIRNIGLGPALDVRFQPRIISGGEAAEKLLAEFTTMNFFSVGLKYFGPNQERASGFTDMTTDHGKVAAVLALDVTYKSATGKNYNDSLIVDMSELKGTYQLGKPHAYAIAQSLEVIQKDIAKISSGFNRIKVSTYRARTEPKNSRMRSLNGKLGKKRTLSGLTTAKERVIDHDRKRSGGIALGRFSLNQAFVRSPGRYVESDRFSTTPNYQVASSKPAARTTHTEAQPPPAGLFVCR